MSKIFAFLFFAIGIVAIIALLRFGLSKIPNLYLYSLPGSGSPAQQIKPPTSTPKSTPTSTTKPRSSTPSYTVIQPAPPEPFYKKVRFSTISPASGYAGSYSTVSLYIDSDKPINLTGWRIKSRQDSFVIPDAIEYYGGSLGDRRGDINMKRGDRIYIYSMSGKILGGLRLNKCMGFLQQTMKFEPGVYTGCPSDKPKNLSDFTPTCQDYINTLGACQIPSSNPPVRHDDYSCLEYLRKISYTNCADTHFRDADYLVGEWRVWLGDSFGRPRNIFDPRHDRVQLIAPTGEIVDEYLY